MPSALPASMPVNATMNGPMIAASAPAIMREKMSRPSPSVPSQCSGDGGALAASRSCSCGGYGSSQVAKIAQKTTSPTTIQDSVRNKGGTRQNVARRRNAPTGGWLVARVAISSPPSRTARAGR